MKKLIQDSDTRMKKAIEATRHDLQAIRTGRANPALLERVEVDYYGSKMPLPQVATVTAPEPRMLVISPWDKGALPAIERAIQKSDLGLNPSSDGTIVRLIIPQLTEETRKGLIKNVHKRVEEGKVAIRNIRRDAIEQLRTHKKNAEIGEDEEKRTEGEVQKITDRHIHELDSVQKSKEEELLEV
ncbi:MAG TPA: ribosome recycling factor [Armatimonadota bacterium]|nr:ribosome recycling factor [Armatimonadota bacterium]